MTFSKSDNTGCSGERLAVRAQITSESLLKYSSVKWFLFAFRFKNLPLVLHWLIGEVFSL